MGRTLSEKELEKVRRVRSCKPYDFANYKVKSVNNTGLDPLMNKEVQEGIRITRGIAVKYFIEISKIQDDELFFDLFRRFKVEDIGEYLDEHLAEQKRKSKEYDERRRRREEYDRDQEYDEETKTRYKY